MESVILVKFNREGDAFAAKNALSKASGNFDLDLKEAFVIKKKANGKADIRTGEGDSLGEGMLGGTLIGGLFGLLGGPIGVSFGMLGGMLTGGLWDAVKEDDIRDRLDDLVKKIDGDETLLVAHIFEDSTKTTDDLLQPYEGDLSRIDVNKELYEARKAEIEAIDKAIAEEAAAKAVEKEEKKAEREAKIAALKQKRDDAKQKFINEYEKRKNEYQAWAGQQKSKFEEWKNEQKNKIDDAKKDFLQKRIDKQTATLNELKKKYDAI